MAEKQFSCPQFPFDSAPIVQAYERLKKSDLRNVRTWGKPVQSPDKTRFAQIKYEYDLDAVRIMVATWTENGEIRKEAELGKTEPHEICFVPRLGKLIWKDGCTVCLKSKKQSLPDLCATV